MALYHQSSSEAAENDSAEEAALAAERQLVEEPWEVVPPPDLTEDWDVPSESPAMRLRRRPWCSAVLLCVWLLLLLLGQLATTIWWLLQFRGLDALWAMALSTLAGLLSLIWLAPLQVAAMSLALALTGLPVLNVYSAAALFAPQHGAADQCRCWEVLHVPTFIVLAVMYLAESLPPVLKAEYGEGAYVERVIRTLARMSSLARTACCIALGLYVIVTCFVGSRRLCAWTSQPEACATSGPLAGRGLVLGCHALGLICAEMHCFTVDTYNEDILRFLLVAGQATARRLRGTGPSPASQVALTSPQQPAPAVPQATTPTARWVAFRNIVSWFDEELQRLTSASPEGRLCRVQTLTLRTRRVWSLVEEMVPILRQAAPPTTVVAFLVALRRAAPILAPVIGLLEQLERSGMCPRLALILAQGVLALLIYEAVKEYPNIPHSSLQRLALMVPNFYMDPSTRAKLGYSLSAVKQARKSRRRLFKLLRLPGEALVYGCQTLLWPFSSA